jgi:hypothetical protein
MLQPTSGDVPSSAACMPCTAQAGQELTEEHVGEHGGDDKRAAGKSRVRNILKCKLHTLSNCNKAAGGHLPRAREVRPKEPTNGTPGTDRTWRHHPWTCRTIRADSELLAHLPERARITRSQSVIGSIGATPRIW